MTHHIESLGFLIIYFQTTLIASFTKPNAIWGRISKVVVLEGKVMWPIESIHFHREGSMKGVTNNNKDYPLIPPTQQFYKSCKYHEEHFR